MLAWDSLYLSKHENISSQQQEKTLLKVFTKKLALATFN